MPDVDVRCPVGPRRLFTKLKLGEEFGAVVLPDNLMEFTCSDCARRISREPRYRDRGFRVRVFHRFNLVGELIDTTVQEVWEGGPCLQGR